VFERFTDRARRVVVLAQEEARHLNHNFIGTEHILLGLVREGEGVAAQVLEALDISLDAIRAHVVEIVDHGAQTSAAHIPFTPRAKKVLELSLREAMQLGHNYIGTEHILLGLIREGDGVAAQVPVDLGAELSVVRERVIEVLGGSQAKPETRAPTTADVRGVEPARCSFCGMASPGCGALFMTMSGALMCERCLRLGSSQSGGGSDQEPHD
jgi:ATP-dependent Clp protease ATP-binding subunit ClpC